MKATIRIITAFSLAALFGNATAGDYKSEYDKKIKASQNVGVLGDNLAGDSTNLYTGATSFSATDVSLPTNGLGISLGRSYSVEYDHDIAAVKAPNGSAEKEIFSTRLRLFGDWDLDVPHINTTLAQSSGWVIDSATPQKRCSAVGQVNAVGQASTGLPPKVLGTRSWPFYPGVYWSGYNMHVPGGDQSLLVASLPNAERPSTGGPYHWTTNKDWWVSCLPTAANDAGEGYVARSPDGTKYTFNWLSRRNVTSSSEYDPDIMQPNIGPAYLFRAEYLMLPTRIEDRFGNWIKYTWSTDAFAKLQTITSGAVGSTVADQTITLHYGTNGFVDWVRDGRNKSDGTPRQWNYEYGGNSLTKVTLPDGTFWQYGLGGVSPLSEDLIPVCTLDENITDPALRYWGCYGGGDTPSYSAVGTVKHPSGAQVDFTFGVHFQFSRSSSWSYPIGLTQKTISGPGLTPATWKYNFLPSKEEIKDLCYVYNCPIRLMTDQLNPDSSIVRRIYGLQQTIDESLLLGQLEGSLAPNGGGSPNITTSTRWGTDILDDVAPASGAVPYWYRELDYRYVPATPAPSYTVRVGVHPLFYTPPPMQIYASERRLPMSKRVLTQQAVTFTNQTNSFDSYAKPTSVTRFSVGGAGGNFSRAELTAYETDMAKWVVGQVKTVTCSGNADCTPNKIVSKIEYDPATRLPWKVYGFDQLNPEATLTYNVNGTVASAKDARGFSTNLSTYTLGIPASIQHPDGTFQKAGINTLGQIEWIDDQLNSRTCFSYDDMVRVKQVTYTSESAERICNSSAWSVTSMPFVKATASAYGLPVGHWTLTKSTGNGRSTTYYDSLWNPVLTKVEDLSNAFTLSFVVNRFDAMGRKVFSSYPVASLTSVNDVLDGVRTEYDGLGRVLRTKQDSELLAPADVLTTSNEYLGGHQIRVTNPRGHSTLTSYQSYDSPTTDSPVTIIAPEGLNTVILRQPSFAKTTALQRSGQYSGATLAATRSYVYDSNERLCKTIDPESGATVIEYDLNGNVLWTADGLSLPQTGSCDRGAPLVSQKTSRTIDPMNRVTRVTTPGAVADIETIYALDGMATQIKAWNPGADTVTNTYVYNRRRLLTQEKLQVNSLLPWTFDYAYNANGHLNSQTYPGALLIGYAPDALGRPTQAGTFATGVTYYPNGAISGFTYGNGIVHTMTQNDRQLPARSLDAFGATKFLDDTYTYDGNGNVLSMADAAGTGLNNRTWGVAAPTLYDGLDRLLSVRGTNWGTLTGSYNALYSYDPLDNIRSAKIGASGYTHAYDVGPGTSGTNRLVSMQLNGGTTYALGTDAKGNITSDARTSHGYQFDLAHRLTAVTGPGAESYLYDGNGRRARTLNSTTGTIEYFGYGADGRLLQDWSNRRQVRNGYIYLGNTLVGLHEVNITNGATASRYKHTDALGSPVATTDSARNITGRTVYTPYGIPMTPVDGVGYTGHFNDVGTGLTYMQQRYYDPQVGRFLSIDPMQSSSQTGWNFSRYAYVGNNPYRYVDPDGRKLAFSSKAAEDLASETAANSEVAAEQLATAKASPWQVTIGLASNAQEAAQERDPRNNQSNATPDTADAENVHPNADGTPGSGTNVQVTIFKDEKVAIHENGKVRAEPIKRGETLVHELAHAIQQISGMLSRDVPTRENHAKTVEDSYRAEQGLSGRRMP